MVRSFLLALSLALLPYSAEAALTRLLNMEEMIESADRIFLGTVIDVRSESKTRRGMASVTTTFRVDEVYKGTIGTEVVVRQAALPGPRNTFQTLSGLTRFRTGQKMVLFLTKESGAGFSSPVGFSQGVFHLLRGEKSDLRSAPIRNGSGTAPLFQRLKKTQIRELARPLESRTQLTLGDLRQLIQVHEEAAQ